MRVSTLTTCGFETEKNCPSARLHEDLALVVAAQRLDQPEEQGLLLVVPVPLPVKAGEPDVVFAVAIDGRKTLRI